MTRGLVVMGRRPRPGRVKTRLSPPLSPEQAATLYAAFLGDVLDLAERAAARAGARRVFCLDAVDEDAAALAPGWPVAVQRGDDLGARIESARAAGSAEHVVVIGSDSPTMPVERIVEAFDHLASHDAVLGPSEDGGYDLIGFARPCPALLTGIPWSTPGVRAATSDAAVRAGLRLAQLDLGYDVDLVADLPRTLADAEAPATRAPRTAAAIRAVLATLHGRG